MKKKYSLYFLLWSMFFAPKIFAQSNQMDLFFKDFKKTFLDTYWYINPTSASLNGLTIYDSILYMPSKANIQTRITEHKDLLEQLRTFPPEQLNASNRVDYYLMENQLESNIWYDEVLQPQKWDASYYIIGSQFDKILENEYTPDYKLYFLLPKIEKLTEYYKIPRENIDVPSLPHAKLALQQIEGMKHIFYVKIPALIEAYKNSPDKGIYAIDLAKFQTELEKAQLAIVSYNLYLKNDAVLRAEIARVPKDWRLGEELYQQKFALDLESSYTPEELHQKALTEKDEIHQKMIALTAEIWPKYFSESIDTFTLNEVKKLLNFLSKSHVQAAEFVTTVEKQIPELSEFVEEHDLIDLDPQKPLIVRKTPLYLRGLAGASISAPGPYEPDRPTYYNVDPLDEMPADKAESFLREYNNYMLQILNIHEAIPGHYVQLLYARKNASVIKSLFGNGTMIEGWACYAERMMLEAGYGNQSPELWLMYYKWNLRILCNALIDYGVHTQNMSEEEVLQLLTGEAFQEQAEAEAKWRRAQLSSVQLSSYYAGLTEIYAFRETMKKQQGQAFVLKDFNEEFLRYGSAPIRYIKQMMSPN
ncbi:MAG: DUF885 domain-containing protein [Bacteroidetes bacterium]|nr:DUF885 domain-containing protein [Bacteroidota bacterium]